VGHSIRRRIWATRITSAPVASWFRAQTITVLVRMIDDAETIVFFFRHNLQTMQMECIVLEISEKDAWIPSRQGV